jgi:hypothetical protein
MFAKSVSPSHEVDPNTGIHVTVAVLSSPLIVTKHLPDREYGLHNNLLFHSTDDFVFHF